MGNKTTFTPKPDSSLIKHLEVVSTLYNKLPDWKKGILESSLIAVSPVPRPEIVESQEEEK